MHGMHTLHCRVCNEVVSVIGRSSDQEPNRKGLWIGNIGILAKILAASCSYSVTSWRLLFFAKMQDVLELAISFIGTESPNFRAGKKSLDRKSWAKKHPYLPNP